MKHAAKKLLALFLALTCLFGFCVPAFAADALPKGAVLLTDSKIIKPNDIQIIAHRGLSACAPENTLAAFKLAGRSGCDGCEIDVRLTLDQRWVCFANPSVELTTNGVGLVAALPYDVLSDYTINRGGNIDQYPDEKIPTLEEAVAVCQLYGMKVVINIRGGTADQIDSLILTLKTLGVMKSATVISANHEILRKIQQNGGRAVYNALLAITAGDINTAVTNGYVGLSTSTVLPLSTMMTQVINNNLEIYAFDVNTLAKAESMYQSGIKTVISDSLVRHAPEAEKLSATILTGITRFFNEIINLFNKLIRRISIQLALENLKNSLGL